MVTAQLTRIVLVACSSTKLDHAAPAKDLYTGQLFRKGRAYAEATGSRWHILSAKYGLVDPDQVIEPYDLRLSHRLEESVGWGGRVKDQLRSKHGQGRDKVFVVLAGEQYAKFLMSSPYKYEMPLRGLGIGQQLKWLTEATAAAREQSEGHDMVTSTKERTPVRPPAKKVAAKKVAQKASAKNPAPVTVTTVKGALKASDLVPTAAQKAAAEPARRLVVKPAGGKLTSEQTKDIHAAIDKAAATGGTFGGVNVIPDEKPLVATSEADWAAAKAGGDKAPSVKFTGARPEPVKAEPVKATPTKVVDKPKPKGKFKAVSVTASLEDWLNAVKLADATINPRPTMPILAALVVGRNDKGVVTVRAGDLEQWSETVLDEAYMDGSALVVNGRQLLATLKGITSGLNATYSHRERITVTRHSEDRVSVSGFERDLRLEVDALPFEDYPAFPAMPEVTASLPAVSLAGGFGFAAVSAGSDSTLPMLTGVRVEMEQATARFAGTDRYTLAVTEVLALVLKPFEALVPATARKLLGSLSGTVEVCRNPAPKTGEDTAPGAGYIGFQTAKTRIWVATLDATFPAYRSLMPDVNESSAWAVDRLQLLADVQAAASILDRNAPVKIEFTPGKYQVEGCAIHSAPGKGDGSWTTAFNPAFLSEGLKALDDPTLQFYGHLPNKPMTLMGTRNGFKATYVLMPVRLP